MTELLPPDSWVDDGLGLQEASAQYTSPLSVLRVQSWEILLPHPTLLRLHGTSVPPGRARDPIPIYTEEKVRHRPTSENSYSAPADLVTPRPTLKGLAEERNFSVVQLTKGASLVAYP